MKAFVMNFKFYLENVIPANNPTFSAEQPPPAFHAAKKMIGTSRWFVAMMATTSQGRNPLRRSEEDVWLIIFFNSA